MHLILLPGNGRYNKAWIDKVRYTLSDLFISTHVLYYNHWFDEDESKEINIPEEQKKLIEITSNLDEYVIFAKSAGSLVTIKSIHENLIAPKKCFFAGHPVNWAKYRNYPVETWISNFSVPTLFIQKTTDPVFSFEELKNFLKKQNVQNFKLIEQIGDNHEYEDLELLRKEFIDFIGEDLS